MRFTVCIIGGGPAGLAAAKALAEEDVFHRIDVFERESQTGGVWNFNDKKKQRARFVPSDDPIDFSRLDADQYSAMYRHLETNLNYRLMEYKDLKFPSGTVDHPDRTEVLEYLKNYQKTLPENKNITLNFNASVIDVNKKDNFWEITVEQNGERQQLKYEFVVVCCGHYFYPYIPDTPGLHEWWKNDESSIIHSKDFVDCESFLGKKVLVVGNGFSGIDISIQLSETSERPVYVSGRHKAMEDLPIEEVVTEVCEVARYDHRSRSATLLDDTVIDELDQIVFCTGYLYAFPFLKSFLNSIDNDDDALLLHNGSRVRRLYGQLFYIPDPTISFIGLQKNVVPMPLAECQAAVIARVYAGRLKLPDQQQMREAEKKELQEHGSEARYHLFPTPADIEYYDKLIDWADQCAEPHKGFKAERWTEERRSMRLRAGEEKTKLLIELIENINEKRKKRGLH